MQHYRKILSQN